MPRRVARVRLHAVRRLPDHGDLKGAPDWIERLEATGPDFILWPHRRGDGQRKLWQLLETGRWTAVHRDATSWLLARRSYPLPQPPRPAAEGPWRDVARAWIAALSGDTRQTFQYSTRAREAMPWNKHACMLSVRSLRVTGEQALADQVLRECRHWFPSRTLR